VSGAISRRSEKEKVPGVFSNSLKWPTRLARPACLCFKHLLRGVAEAVLYCAHSFFDARRARQAGRARREAGSSGLSRLSGWSDRKFIQKNQTDQINQPTRQTNPGALRKHRRSSGSIPSVFREQEDNQAAHPFLPRSLVTPSGMGADGSSTARNFLTLPTHWQIFLTRPALRLHRNRFPRTRQ
jgi:hypothetical protein